MRRTIAGTDIRTILSLTAFSGVMTLTQVVSAQHYRVETAPEWTALFDRDSGWTGADGIYSIPLSGIDGPTGNEHERTLFLFSDTFVGEVDKQGERLPGSTLVNNSIAVMDGLRPDPARTRFFFRHKPNGNARAMVIPNTPHADPGQWYWFLDGIAVDHQVHVFALRMKEGNGGEFNFAVDGVAMLSASADLQHVQNPVQQETPLFLEATQDRGEIIMGGAIMPNTHEAGAPHPDGYIYIYGTQNDPFIKKLVAARVRPDQLHHFDQWEFFDGAHWANHIESVAPLTGRISSEFSVTPLPDGKYILVFQEDTLGRYVAIKIGDSPVGPWGPLRGIYKCPEPGQLKDVYTYNAKAHPHLSKPGELLISYNVNSFNFWDHFKYADIYRPRFIRLILDQ